MTKTTLSALLWSTLFLFSACNEETPIAPPSAAYGTGVFVVNEGPFQNGTGTISFFTPSTGAVQQQVFSNANNRPLGNVAQSMASFGSIGMIVVNNANKLEFVDLKDFSSTGTIADLALPSRIAVAGNTGKAYLTEWVSFTGDGRVSVIDIGTRSITAQIPVGAFPNAIIYHDNRIFVANSNANEVLEISIAADTVVRSFSVGDRPTGFVSDGNKLWVLCAGNPDWTGNETAGQLVSIEGGQVTAYAFPNQTDHPSHLVRQNSSGELLYQLNGGVRNVSLNGSSVMVTNPVIDRSFYYFAADPSAGGLIYGTDARDFASNGWVYRYDNSFGLRDSFPVGIAPGFIHFR